MLRESDRVDKKRRSVSLNIYVMPTKRQKWPKMPDLRVPRAIGTDFFRLD